MKQTKISYCLKGVDIVLAVMVIGLVGFLTWIKITPQLIVEMAITKGVFFLPILYLLACIALFVLYEFWHVCTQIGKDNSFSQENAKSFHHMTMAGLASEIVFLIKIIMIIFINGYKFLPIILTMVEILIAFIVMVICECLSKLIFNAYEMKNENDLTI